jgi:colicin import membrane protein
LVKLHRSLSFAIIFIAAYAITTRASGQNDVKNRAQTALGGITASGGSKDLHIAAQREQLVSDRAAVQARFNAGTPNCYQKFAVNACLDALRVERREALADLRRQEIELNNQERRQLAAEQTQIVEQNLREARERDAQSSPVPLSAPTAASSAAPTSAASATAPGTNAVAAQGKARQARAVSARALPASAASAAQPRPLRTSASISAKRQARDQQAAQRAQRASNKQTELEAAQKAAQQREQERKASGQPSVKGLPLPP